MNQPYADSLPNLKKTIANKHILLDTDAIISTISYDAKGLFSDFTNHGATLAIIHPVYIELLATNSPEERTKRMKIIDDHKIITLPLRKISEYSPLVQEYLSLIGRYPSPTDIFLGATLARFNNSMTLLATSNLRDFPTPLYRRVGCVVLNNSIQSKNLWILELDHSELQKSAPF